MSTAVQLKVCKTCRIAKRPAGYGDTGECVDCQGTTQKMRFCTDCGRKRSLDSFINSTFHRVGYRVCADCRAVKTRASGAKRYAARQAAKPPPSLCSGTVPKKGHGTARPCTSRAMSGSDRCQHHQVEEAPAPVPAPAPRAVVGELERLRAQLRVCAVALVSVRDDRLHGLEWAREVTRVAIENCAEMEEL